MSDYCKSNDEDKLVPTSSEIHVAEDQEASETVTQCLKDSVSNGVGILVHFVAADDARPLSLTQVAQREKVKLPDSYTIDKAVTASVFALVDPVMMASVRYFSKVIEHPEQGAEIFYRTRLDSFDWVEKMTVDDVMDLTVNGISFVLCFSSATFLVLLTMMTSPGMLALDVILDSPEKRKLKEFFVGAHH